MSNNRHTIKSPVPHLKKKMDARVRRTRDALGDALVELMQEKPFDSITVLFFFAHQQYFLVSRFIVFTLRTVALRPRLFSRIGP